MSKSRVLTDEQFTWYETKLPLFERKKRGHFSTPPLLVEKILDACGYTSDNDLTRVRVLDPACGSGNFLIGAVSRLQAFCLRTGLSPKKSALLFQRNLWGIDPDPISCFLAEMHLQAFIHSGTSRPVPNTPLHIHQADSYLLFLDLALQVVRPGGWIGLVLPDPLLARANAAREPARLLEETTIYHLWHFSDVFAAEVGAVVIIARKTQPKGMHSISWNRGRWHSTASSTPQHEVQQSLFSHQPGNEFRYLLSQERGNAIERLRTCLEEPPSGKRRFAPLGEYLAISRGEELGKESPFLQQIPFRPGLHMALDASRSGDLPKSDSLVVLPDSFPVLRGGIDIHPFSPPVANCFIARDAIRKPLERYLSPKLCVVKSTDRLQATLDDQGHIALQTLYLLHLRTPNDTLDQLYFFLALLNSRLVREYVYALHSAYKLVQPQIEQRVLASLPVPLVTSEEQQQIIAQSKAIVHACGSSDPVVEWSKHITSMYEQLEHSICDLYDSALAGSLLTKES